MEKFYKKGHLKRKGKRLLTLLLCICLIGTMIPVTAKASSSGHTHCICGATHNGIGDHTAEESLEWQPWGCWGDGSNFPTESGNYYLTENVNLYSKSAGWWEIKNGITINLCLNGHQFTADNIRLAQVDSGGKLVITDCVGTGYITVGNADNNYGHCVKVNSGGTFNLYGGELKGFNRIVENSGTFKMYGGTLCNNEGGIDFGGGLYNKGTFYMYGGTISDCGIDFDSYYGGGGVYNEGTVYMSGGSITNCGLDKTNTSATVYAKGSGVYNEGTFHMSGGSITGNKAYAASNVGTDTYGYGVYNQGTLNLSGNVNISENVIGYTNGTPANLLISLGNSVINPANITGNLDSSSTIGVTHLYGDGTVAKVAQGVTANPACFIPDDAEKKAAKNSSGDIILKNANLVEVTGTVKVLDSLLGNATISFSSESQNASVDTNASGVYCVNLLPGTYAVSMTTKTKETLSLGTLTINKGDNSKTVDYLLTKLTGTVKDGSSQGIANAKVSYGTEYYGYSDSSGNYTVLMPQNLLSDGTEFNVSAESLQYAAVTETVSFSGSGMTRDFTLTTVIGGNELHVANEADLVRLATFENILSGRTIVIDEDIALTGTFQGIQLSDSCTLTIKGNDHTISGLTTPLFAPNKTNINLTGSVSNLHLRGNVSMSGYYVGAFAREGQNLTLDGCSFEGNIAAKDNGADIGGLLGYCNGNVTIKNCYVSLDKISGNNTQRVGGLCGYADGVTVQNCFVRIKDIGITLNETNGRLGGIVGYGGDIDNCYVVVTGSNQLQYALGKKDESATVRKVYAQTGSAGDYSNVTQLSADVMTAKAGTTVDSATALVDRLNANVTTSNSYKKWYNGTDGYPCFTIPTYTITFNGGTKGTGSQEAKSFKLGEQVALPGVVYKNSDYVQKGWATEDGGTKKYELSETLSETNSPTDDMMLYPYWEAKPAAECEAPTGLTATYGDTLNNISLPDNRFTWNAPDTTVGDVGTHTFTATYTPTGEEAEKYGKNTIVQISVEVKKAQSRYTTQVSKATNLTYNRTAQALVTAGTTSDGTIVYSLTGNDDYTSTIPTATNPGDYTVYYKIKGDANHEDSEVGSVSVSIKKANLEGAEIALGNTLTYNGKEQTQSIDSVKVGTMTLGAGDYTVTGNKGTNAGDYTLTVTGNGNFEGSKQVTFTIAKSTYSPTVKKDIYLDLSETGTKTLTATDLFDTDMPAGATIESCTKTADDDAIISEGSTVKNGVFSYTPAVSADKTGKEATYEFTVSSKNYEDITVTVTFKVKEKKNVSITGVSVDNKTYDGKAMSYTGTLSALWNGTSVSVAFTCTWQKNTSEDTWETISEAPVNAGKYRLIVAVADSEPEYKGSLAPMEFTIEKKKVTVAPLNQSIYAKTSNDEVENVEIDTSAVAYKGFIGTDNDNNAAIKSTADVVCNVTDYTTAGTYKDVLSIDDVGALTDEMAKNYELVNGGTATLNIVSTTYNENGGNQIKLDDSSSGIVTTDTVQEADLPKTEIGNLTKTLVKALLGETDASNVNNGANALIYLDVTNAKEEVTAVEKTKIADAAGSRFKVADTYLDLSLYKKVGNTSAKKLTDLNGNKIKVEIQLPENMRPASTVTRTFTVIRMHEEEAEALSATYDKTKKTLVFETDKFSVYAIAYQDTKNSTGGGGSTSGGGGGISNVPVTGITVTPKNATLTKAGETLQLTAEVSPSYATNKNVTWTSDNEAVATVDSTGKVTAVGNGTATITATTQSGSKTATVVITVNIASGENDKPSVPTDTDKPSVPTETEKPPVIIPTASTTPMITDKPIVSATPIVTVTPIITATPIVTVTPAEPTPSVVPTAPAETATPKDTEAPAETDTPKDTTTPKVTATPKPTAIPKKVTSDFGTLKARSDKQTSTTVTLKWSKVSKADGYLIYGSKCNTKDKKYTNKLLKTIKGNKTLSWTQKKLKKATGYKYQIKAYKLVKGKKVVIAQSVGVYAITKGGKYCVTDAIKVTKLAGKKVSTKSLKLTLKKGKTAQITAAETPAEKKKSIKRYRGLCYESSNSKVATVTKSGKIKAVKKGTCKIYVYAQNGVYKTITITVK